MIKHALVGALLLLLLSGCATYGDLYSWGRYEKDLFNYYHEPSLKEEVIRDHAEFVLRIHERGEKPAPGLLAEAGTFYLQEGDVESAIRFYRLEYEVWPESRPMMSVLIKNLEGN